MTDDHDGLREWLGPAGSRPSALSRAMGDRPACSRTEADAADHAVESARDRAWQPAVAGLPPES